MYYGEKLNGITHLLGTVFALIGLGVLLATSAQTGNPELIFSFTIFGVTLVLLYTMSTLYHSIRAKRIKRIFQKLDYVAIYLLIGGTYTPYSLVTLKNGSGPTMLIGIWILALIGILMDLFISERKEWLQVPLYLIMGWACALNFTELSAGLALPGLIWLIAGGIIYTAGVTFYLLDHFGKLQHAHGIWHVFVLAGSVCHFISIAAYVR